MFARTRIPRLTTDLIEGTLARGGEMWGLTHCRGILTVLSFLTDLGFDPLTAWQEVRRLPLEEQQRAAARPEDRRRLVDAALHGDYGQASAPRPVRRTSKRSDPLVAVCGPTRPSPRRRRRVGSTRSKR